MIPLEFEIIFLAMFTCMTCQAQTDSSTVEDEKPLVKAVANAEKLVARNQFRQAEHLLLSVATSEYDQNSEFAAYLQSHIDLGELYLRSEHFDGAIEWAERLEKLLHGSRTVSIDKAAYLDRALILRGRSLKESGRSVEAAALLRQAFRDRIAANDANPMSRLRICATLAEIESELPRPDIGDVIATTRRDIETIADLAKTGTVDARLSQDAHQYAARVEASAGNADGAILLIGKLDDTKTADTMSTDDIVHFEEYIASLLRVRKQYEGELLILRDARSRIIDNRAAAASENAVTGKPFRVASLTERIGWALLKSDQVAAGNRELNAAFRAYEELLLKHQAESKLDAEVISDLLTRIQALDDYLPKTRRARSLDEVAVKEQLLQAYYTNRLDNDPQTNHLRISLATSWLVRGEPTRAETLLTKAVPYWRARRPRDVETLVRSLVLFAETKRSQGALDDAGRLLVEALNYCEGEDLTLRRLVSLNQGRLAVSSGQLRAATESFRKLLDDIQNQTGVQDPLSSEVFADCLLNLALIDHLQLRFEAATSKCERAAAIRGQFLNASDERMVPYYLASASAYAAQRDVDALEGSLSHCTDLALDQMTSTWETVRHLQATACFLRDNRSPNPQDRNEALVIWTDLLTRQQAKLNNLSAARTQHYLSALKFREWSERQRLWNSTDIDAGRSGFNALSIYKSKLQSFNEEVTKFAKELEAFNAQKTRYSDELLPIYDRLMNRNAPQLQEAYEEVVSEKLRLDTEKDRLLDVHSKLRDRETVLKREYAALTVHSNEGVDWLTQAEGHARAAVATLADSGVHADLYCAALCNFAQILDRQSQLDPDNESISAEAVDCLSKAIDAVETVHVLTLSGEASKEEFLSRFRLPYELLIEWNAAHGNHRDALVTAELLSNREFLQQLVRTKLLAEGETSDDQRQLIEEFKSLVEQYHEAAARVVTSGDTQNYSANDADYNLTQIKKQCAAAYARLWQRHTIASRELGDASSRMGISLAVDAAFAANEVILYYQIGTQSCHAFLIDGIHDRVTGITLKAPESPTRNSSPNLVSGDLDRRVEEYLAVYGGQDNSTSLTTQKEIIVNLSELSEIVLPNELREQVRQIGPERLTIIAGGALQRLPLEALVVKSDSLRFLIDDDFPPLAYAPSLMTLQELWQRNAGSVPPRLLTVGNPQFSSQSRLPALPQSHVECEQVANGFRKLGAMILMGNEATEQAFRDAVARSDRPFSHVHIATHGVVAGQGVFAHLAFTAPPLPENANDDGKLEIHEIAELNLKPCELVVLSVCRSAGDETEVSDASNLGMTLAGAFLTAGVQRVVASRWRVSDEASSQIMSSFYQRIATALEQGVPQIDYARLLRDAVTEYRETRPEHRNSPFHWASFTLIGPASDR